MKYSINKEIFAFILLLCIASCKSDDEGPTGDVDKFTSFSELVESLKTEEQAIIIEDPTGDQSITGKDGVIINISANAFTDDGGEPVNTPVTAILNEYLNTENMLLNNVQTESNGRILVTGGSIEITFEDENGNSVNSAPFSLQAMIPVQTDIVGFEDDMRYFIGTRTDVDGREMVNWEFGENSEAWFTDGGVFNIAGLEQGLANCDVLYDLASDVPTQFEVCIDGLTDYSQAVVWMVVEDFPSLINISTLNSTNDALQTYANSIPTGMKATLLAINVDDDDYLKYGSLAITVAGDDKFTLTTDFGTKSGLETLIASITN